MHAAAFARISAALFCLALIPVGGIASQPAFSPQIRVGLATDVDSFALHQGYFVNSESQRLEVSEQGIVRPSKETLSRRYYRLQVAALKDENHARGVATRVTTEANLEAAVVFDAGSDLYRVRVGRYPTPERARSEAGRLIALGHEAPWVVAEGDPPTNPGFEIEISGTHSEIAGQRWLTIENPDGLRQLTFKGTNYRGKLLLFINDRGLINVINELSLEDYLRGVVPKEMGPSLYPELEAIKAQTVAARTYTLRNLGEFVDEGYDICSTRRCQVYAGTSQEHPTSDRAVLETAGQVVLFDGQPAETLYSATCGGHTEDVAIVFPEKQAPYLRGVPCVEQPATHFKVGRSGSSAISFPGAISRRLLPASSGDATTVLTARFEHLALLAGLAVPSDRLRSLHRDEILRFTASVLDLVLDRRVVSHLDELQSLLRQPPTEWGIRERQLAHFLARSEWRRNPSLSAEPDEVEELLYELALFLGILEREIVLFLERDKSDLRVKSSSRFRTVSVSPRLQSFVRRDHRAIPAGLSLQPGDQLELIRHREELLAIVQREVTRIPDLKSKASRQQWKTTISAAELSTRVQARYPGFPILDFEVLSRGVSGRAKAVRLLGSGGRELTVEGLAIRWTLGIYDTLFTVERHLSPSGKRSWTFSGRGWGHGVGMCQVGAYGMAVRGSSYQDILGHYYSGITLGKIKSTPAPTARDDLE